MDQAEADFAIIAKSSQWSFGCSAAYKMKEGRAFSFTSSPPLPNCLRALCSRPCSLLHRPESHQCLAPPPPAAAPLPDQHQQLQSSPGSIFVRGALLSSLFRLHPWCVPEVGPVASGLGSDSVPPSGRCRPQSQQFQLQHQSQSLRQSLRSFRDFGDIRHGWDPGPLRQYHRGDLGGPGPPSGPVLQDRGSPRHPGPSHHHQLQRRRHRLSYPPPRGSGGPYSSGILSRAMSGFTREIFMGSHTMMSRR